MRWDGRAERNGGYIDAQLRACTYVHDAEYRCLEGLGHPNEQAVRTQLAATTKYDSSPLPLTDGPHHHHRPLQVTILGITQKGYPPPPLL